MNIKQMLDAAYDGKAYPAVTITCNRCGREVTISDDMCGTISAAHKEIEDRKVCFKIIYVHELACSILDELIRYNDSGEHTEVSEIS